MPEGTFPPPGGKSMLVVNLQFETLKSPTRPLWMWASRPYALPPLDQIPSIRMDMAAVREGGDVRPKGNPGHSAGAASSARRYTQRPPPETSMPYGEISVP